MGIPIITELNREITRLYIAGSPLAKGDPRIVKYIEPLAQLGQRAPVFQALAAKLTELTQGDEYGSPERLMEAGMLVNSIIYTQGSTELDGAAETVVFGSEPLKPDKLPYSQLYRLNNLLSKQNLEHAEELVQIHQSGRYRDPRLYQGYCQAIGDRKSFISDYVIDHIIPDLGSEILPFLEEVLNLQGTRRDARIFRALYHLRGKEILPLSLQALEQGTAPVMAEAVYTLCEDPGYEELLRGYLEDKKAEIRQAAYTALERMNPELAEEPILKALKKKTVSHLAEVLKETDNPRLAAAVLAEVQQAMEALADKAAKIKVLLEVLADRGEREGLDYLKSLFLDRQEFDKRIKKLDLYGLLDRLYKQDVPEKNQLVYEIACENEVFMEYRLYTARRLFSAEQVYELCSGECRKNKSMLAALRTAYNFDAAIPDAQKTWDRRWFQLYLEKQQIESAFLSLYQDDEQGWSQLLALAVSMMAKSKSPSIYYLRYLKKAKEIGHPQFEHYYQEYLKAGFAREVLAERI